MPALLTHAPTWLIAVLAALTVLLFVQATLLLKEHAERRRPLLLKTAGVLMALVAVLALLVIGLLAMRLLV